MVEVAIGIVLAASRVLVCRRRRGDRFEDCWEFPGGKLDVGETPEACLHRELEEELGIRVRVIRNLPAIRHDYGDFAVTLWPFLLDLAAGEPQAKAARTLRWVDAAELDTLPFPAANADLIREVAALLRAQ
jgi:mutator protein MutT